MVQVTSEVWAPCRLAAFVCTIRNMQCQVLTAEELENTEIKICFSLMELCSVVVVE